MTLWNQVTIIGTGLIGGSLGLALKQRRLAGRVVGVGHRQGTLDEALFRRAADEATLDPCEGVRGSDLVVLGTAVGLFEETIARYTALAVLLPVVAGQSGNTGAQALAVTMRGLALREIRTRQWFRVCFKEMNVGAFNGIAVALTTSLGVLAWSRSFGLALVIGSSMVLSMVAAGLSGAGVPLVLTALGQDPAQSSSIVLTTITDVVGFFSFLGIATLLAGLL